MPTQPPNTIGQLSLLTPQRLHVARYIRNGLIPNASFETEIGNDLNFVAAARVKEHFSWAVPLTAIPTGNGTRDRWRFASHTSPFCRRLKAVVLMAMSDKDPAPPVGTTITITNATGSTTYGSVTIDYGANAVGLATDMPVEYGTFDVVIAAPADTDIYGLVTDVGHGRIIAITVYEEGLKLLTGNGYLEPSQVAVGSPIQDQRTQDAYELGALLWKRQAAHLWNWTVDLQGTPLTTNSATPRNIVDNTSTTISAATPGVTIDLRYCRTVARSTVPCVLKAYGSFSSGTGGAVAILGSGGGVLGQIFNGWTSSTPAWASATINMPANLDKLDLHFSAGSGFGTFSLGAVSLYQHI